MTELNRESIRVSIENSANWVIQTSTAANQGVTILNSGGLFAMQSGAWTVGISNSAGWIVNVANTLGVIAISNTSPLVSIQNSAGWIVSVANTGETVNIANSAGWVVYAIDSQPKVISITTVVSTIGTVTLMNSNVARVEGFIYNASQNPLFMRLGSSASTTFYTLMMVASGYYELPRPVFQGQITGIWGTAQGQAVVTEIS